MMSMEDSALMVEEGETRESATEIDFQNDSNTRLRKIALGLLVCVGACVACVAFSALPAHNVPPPEGKSESSVGGMAILSEVGIPGPADLPATLYDFCTLDLGDTTVAALIDHVGLEDWPEVSQDSYAAISQCVTMVPYCDPNNLKGTSDLRATYPHASASYLLRAYASKFANAGLMAQLEEEVCGKDNKCQSEFSQTLQQLALEVSQLEEMSGYYDKMFVLMKELGNRFQYALAESMQVLLLASDKTTTTTTTTTAKKKKKWVKWLEFGLQVTAMVGEMMGIPAKATKSAEKGVWKTVATAGKVVKVTSKNADKATKDSAKLAKMEENKNKGGKSPDSDDDPIGFKQDEGIDEEDVGLGIWVQKMERQWQELFLSQRDLLASNWGLLNQAMPMFQLCPLSDEAINLALDFASPGIDWFATSALIPNKYVIYAQRDYGMGSTCGYYPAACLTPCSDIGAGCFTAGSEPTDWSATIDSSSAVKPTLQFWLGQVGHPDYGPPGAFWDYLLDEDGPVFNYIMPRLNDSNVSDKVRTEVINYLTFEGINSSSEAQAETETLNQNGHVPKHVALSDLILSQCQFIPKTYFRNYDIEDDDGEASSHRMQCNIFGAPWIVQWMPDCNACASSWTTAALNGFYCDATNSQDRGSPCANTSVANFNSQVLIPKEAYKYDTAIHSLKGCCMPAGMDPEDLITGCDFPICDCATTAALMWTNGGGTAGKIDNFHNPIWFGACAEYFPELPDYGLVSFEASMTPDDYLMTSLGIRWPEVYTNYELLENITVTLNNINWKSAINQSNQISGAYPNASQQVVDNINKTMCESDVAYCGYPLGAAIKYKYR